VSKKYEDGIWVGRYGNGEGDFGVRFLVKEQSFARRLSDGTYNGVSCTFLPLHRIADLDGKPVVEASVEAENERLREALEWYAEQTRLCRLIHSEGDIGRQALADDGGKKAREALSPAKESVKSE
jgi:hypothetical protein